MLINSVIVILLFITINFLRFLLTDKYNKFLLCASLFGVAYYLSFFTNDPSQIIFSFFFVIILSILSNDGFEIVSVTLSSIVLLTSNLPYYTMVFGIASFIFGSLIICTFMDTYKTNKSMLKDADLDLKRRSKELNVIRNISLILQTILDYEGLKMITLKFLTAGFDFSFKRAFLFMPENSGDFMIYDSCSIPNSDHEAYIIWSKLVRNPKNFANLTFSSSCPNEIKNIKIPLNEDNIFTKTVLEKEVKKVDKIDFNDSIQLELYRIIKSTSFALLPLIDKNIVIGIILVDNSNSDKKIQYEDLDNAMPIINQAATAIENAKLYKKTILESVTDGLTGLHNKRYLEKQFELLKQKSNKENKDLSLLIMDIDYFKNYNDINGHIAGDEALKLVGDILKNHAREEDIVSRFGGEEFCIMLYNTDKNLAKIIAERIRKKIEYTSFYNQSSQPNGNLTISIGVSQFNKDDNLNNFIENSDRALYKAKACGRNNVQVYE